MTEKNVIPSPGVTRRWPVATSSGDDTWQPIQTLAYRKATSSARLVQVRTRTTSPTPTAETVAAARLATDAGSRLCPARLAACLKATDTLAARSSGDMQGGQVVPPGSRLGRPAQLGTHTPHLASTDRSRLPTWVKGALCGESPPA